MAKLLPGERIHVVNEVGSSQPLIVIRPVFSSCCRDLLHEGVGPGVHPTPVSAPFP